MNAICLCMSPAIDTTMFVPAFPHSGDVFAGVGETLTVGGKGLNVARWLTRHGHAVRLGGLLGEENAACFERELAACGIEDALLRVPGPTRQNVMVSAPDGMFKMNRPAFPGLRPGSVSVESILEKIGDAPADFAVLSGSLPKAVSAGFYAEIGTALRARGVAVVLDTSGAPLREGMPMRPDLVKPNAEECEDFVGFRPRTPVDFEKATRILCETCGIALVSDGGEGCYCATAEGGFRLYRVAAPRVEVRDTTAAGDTLLAEFCHAYFPRRELTEDVLRRAVAAGSAAVQHPGAEPPTFDETAALFPETTVVRLV